MDISQISKQLLPAPKRFPDCCLAISSTLITYLASLLPKKSAFTISIGSGSGLLEGLIVHCDKNVSVEGVEVDSTINRYIAEEDMNIVGGGWGLWSAAQQAAAWMFVYPRDPKLITKYIDTYGNQNVEFIVWLGPRVDWPDYEPRFCQSPFSELSFPDHIGLTPYETVVVARRPYQAAELRDPKDKQEKFVLFDGAEKKRRWEGIQDEFLFHEIDKDEYKSGGSELNLEIYEPLCPSNRMSNLDDEAKDVCLNRFHQKLGDILGFLARNAKETVLEESDSEEAWVYREFMQPRN